MVVGRAHGRLMVKEDVLKHWRIVGIQRVGMKGWRKITFEKHLEGVRREPLLRVSLSLGTLE